MLLLFVAANAGAAVAVSTSAGAGASEDDVKDDDNESSDDLSDDNTKFDDGDDDFGNVMDCDGGGGGDDEGGNSDVDGHSGKLSPFTAMGYNLVVSPRAASLHCVCDDFLLAVSAERNGGSWIPPPISAPFTVAWATDSTRWTVSA